jgi:glycosyltransferase 2 family protein
LDGATVVRLLGQAGVGALLVLVPHPLSMTLESWAWRHAISSVGGRTRFASIWKIRTATEALYLLLPGGVVVAESVKPLLLERSAGLSLELGIGATFYRKFLRLAGQGPYVLLAAFWGGPALLELSLTWFSSSALYWAVLGLGVVFLGLALGLALGMRNAGLAGRLFDFLALFPRLFSNEFLMRVRHRFRETDVVARAFFRLPLRKTWLPILCSGVCWLFEPIESWLGLRVLGLDVPFELVLGVDVAISLLRQAAVFLPGGLGLQEAGYLGALVALGVPAPLETAAAFSVLKRAKDLAWGTFGLVLMSRLLPEGKPPETGPSPLLAAEGATPQGSALVL